MAAKKALLTGINNYQFASDLRGCKSDVEKFQALLRDLFGFQPQHIHTLLDADVIKPNVNEELEWLLKGAKAGDQLVFMFAGHGSQTADLDEDEPDGVDELLCLYDMDFDDPDSYLLDDDIFRFTKRLPEGAKLTIIFDCCHSGTATRLLLAPTGVRAIPSNKAPLVDLQTTLARSSDRVVTRSLSLKEEGSDVLTRLLEPRTDDQQRQTVLARFIEPPAKVLELMARKGIRRSLHQPRGAKDRRTMNHVFFAASESRQTSADAYIDGGFHGAFSYYFCQQVRGGGADDMQQLLRDVRSALANARFSQIPQLEPSAASGPLLGGTATTTSASVPTSPGKKPPAGKKDETPSASPPSDQPLNQKILALLAEILAELKQQRGAPAAGRAAGQRALVYVHGICRHDPGYSDPWWNALRPHLPADLTAQLESNRHEVLWSEHVTATRELPRVAAPPELVRQYEAREQELADYLRDVVQDRAQREALLDLPVQERSLDPTPVDVPLDRGLGLGLDCIDDFAKYLMRSTVRREVQREFLDVVRPLLEAGASIDIMSHSWGTVVAYESLRQLDDRDLSGSVLNWFTIGSALSMVPVQRRLETRDYIRPRQVSRWINLDARRDFVGGALRSLGYGVDLEFLNLEPVGCRLLRDNPACPHASYFRAENGAVNRGVFARHMT